MNSSPEDLYDLSTIGSEQLVYFLGNGGIGYVKDILSDFLRIPRVKISNDSSNSKSDDNVLRGKILLDIFIDAAQFGYKIGFSPRQMQIWMIVLRDTHGSYFVEAVRKEKTSGALLIMQVFKRKLLKHLTKTGKIFLDIDLKRMIDYFQTIYAQHIRLITWTFSKSQGQTVINVKRQIRLPVVSQPLNEAIPNEKYDDWCRQQEERSKKEKEEEAAKLQKMKLKEEEEARLAAEADKRDNALRQQEIAEMDLLSANRDANSASFPQMESCFPLSEVGSQNVALVIQTKSEVVKREIETYIDQKLQNQTQMIEEKFRQLEIVLEGKEVIKKLQTK